MLQIKLNTKQVDSLQSKLLIFRKQASDKVDKTLATYALLIESQAKENATVDTGFLRSSIHMIREDYKKYRVGVNVNYAKFVEFGTVRTSAQPFLFPAYLSLKPYLLRQLREDIKYKK